MKITVNLGSTATTEHIDENLSRILKWLPLASLDVHSNAFINCCVLINMRTERNSNEKMHKVNEPKSLFFLGFSLPKRKWLVFYHSAQQTLKLPSSLRRLSPS